MLNEARIEADAQRADVAELEELREMRSDVERRDKAHAQLIADQAKRLEQLETLYKEEQARAPLHAWLAALARSAHASLHTLAFQSLRSRSIPLPAPHPQPLASTLHRSTASASSTCWRT